MKIAAATTASTVRIFFFIFSLLLFLTKRNLIFFQVIFFCEELLEDRLCIAFCVFQKSVTDSVFFCLLLHILKSIIDLLQSDLPENTLLLVVNLEGILFHLAA